MLAIRLPADVEERLERLAKATGRTKTWYARKAILEHLDDLEGLYLAEQRLKVPDRRSHNERSDARPVASSKRVPRRLELRIASTMKLEI